MTSQPRDNNRAQDDSTRLVIADDQPLMRRALCDFFEDEPGFEVIGQANNGTEAIELGRSLQPDAILMDLDMPEVSGVEAIEQLTAETQVRCIALTTFSSMDWVLAALRAGASGYLVKDAAPEMIVDAVRDVMNDTMVLSPSVVELLADQVTQSPTTRSPAASAEAPDLTEREQQVVELIAGGLNNKEIAQELHLSEGAVKLHVGKACDRLGARDRVQLLVRAVECGLVTPSLLRPETARDRYR